MEFIIAGKKTVSEQKNNNSVESRINQETQNIGVAKIRMNDLKDNFGYYAEMQLLKSANGDDRRDYFYFGENAFLELFIPRIDLNIGRKLFSSGRSSFTGSRDGKEGISVKLDSGKKISLDFILFDYYRGFPLYEKNIILSRDESKTENGERSRHGIFFDYSLDKLRASAYTLYLNLGNWGEFSKDDYRRNSLGIGDGDFLYHAGTDISYKFSI
ncbi:MAG: hypothetical protein K8R21_12520, partial [Leptospira sp.]|nr:hypothetical protein [Leptospira sp.]